jgi:hypothetical protein
MWELTRQVIRAGLSVGRCDTSETFSGPSHSSRRSRSQGRGDGSRVRSTKRPPIVLAVISLSPESVPFILSNCDRLEVHQLKLETGDSVLQVFVPPSL